MKIAINSLPRSGTKLLQANFHCYIKSAGYDVLCPESFDSILEPFYFSKHELELKESVTRIESIDQYKINFKKGGVPCRITDEVIRRYKYLKSLKQSWVFKRTPRDQFDPILYQSVVDLDKSVAIKRYDFFDHALSLSLAKKLDIWAPTDQLNDAIKNYTMQQIKIEKTEFASDYKWIKEYSKIKWVKDVQVVKFEEMVKLNNSKEFCDFFQLPFIEFNFHQFDIEYGDNKRKMISNIDELILVANNIDEK